MFALPTNEFNKVFHLADHSSSNRVYLLSVVEGVQTGKVFVNSVENPTCALIWHYCGFYYLLGEPDESFLLESADLIRRQKDKMRCFIIEDSNPQCDAYFSNEPDIIRQERFSFFFDRTKDISFKIPAGFQLKELDASLLARLEGNIIPSFSWDSMTEFLEKGKGFCLLYGDEIATVAFSSGICHNEIDIGIETKEAFRKQGLAAIVAKRMVQYVLEIGKEPNWECYMGNQGSRRTAEKAGFVFKKSYPFFKSIT